MPFAFEVGERDVDIFCGGDCYIGQPSFSVESRMRIRYGPSILDIYYLSSLATENAGEWDNVLLYHYRPEFGQDPPERVQVQDMDRWCFTDIFETPVLQDVKKMRKEKP